MSTMPPLIKINNVVESGLRDLLTEAVMYEAGEGKVGLNPKKHTEHQKADDSSVTLSSGDY